MTGSNGLAFTSSEGAVAPRLTVVYELPTSGLSVTQSGGSTSVTEGGQGDSITVALQTAPSANVTVTFNFGNDIGGTPAPLTFTPENWNTAQTVTLSAVDDAFDEGTEVVNVTLSSSSADTNYQGASASVSVTVNDNDQPPPPPPPGGGVQFTTRCCGRASRRRASPLPPASTWTAPTAAGYATRASCPSRTCSATAPARSRSEPS